MLNFKPITLESRRDLLPFLGKKHHSACYQSFATCTCGAASTRPATA